MASGFEMRVGNAEREAIAAELREHYAAGRLTLDELNQRLDQTFTAKTRGDLQALMRDLPSGSSARPGAPGLPGGDWSGMGWGGQRTRSGGTGSGWDAGTDGGQYSGSGAGWRASQAVGAFIPAVLIMGALLAFGSLALGGFGPGRPIGVVLILAALAFLRRLFFRRRHVIRGRGPRRRW